MRREPWDDDCDAHRDFLAREDAYVGSIIDGAFRDILRGDFDSFAVAEAKRLGLVAMATFKG